MKCCLLLAGLLASGCATASAPAAVSAPAAAAVDPAPAADRPDDLPAVIAALADADPVVRREAAVAAGLLGLAHLDAADREMLGAAAASALAAERDEASRARLLWALGRTGGPVVPALLEILGDRPASERRAALLSLGLLAASAPGTAAVAAQAADPDPAVRAAATFALAALRQPAHEELLASLTRDADPQVRAFAARGLGELASRPSLLEALLGDPVARVRVEAARGLLLGATRAASAGRKGRADLAMEEAFADALARSTGALARQARAGRGAVAVQPLLLLLRGPLPTAAGGEALEALAGGEGFVALLRCEAQAALDRAHGRQGAACAPPPSGGRPQVARAAHQAATGDVVLHTVLGPVRIALDEGRAPLAAARLRALVAAGGFDGLAFRHLEPGVALGTVLPGGALPAAPDATPFERGTVAVTLRGATEGGVPGAMELFVTLAPTPHLEGRAPAIGRVVEGMEAVENLLPGDEILRAVLH